jgi:hypothetical protein
MGDGDYLCGYMCVKDITIIVLVSLRTKLNNVCENFNIMLSNLYFI